MGSLRLYADELDIRDDSDTTSRNDVRRWHRFGRGVRTRRGRIRKAEEERMQDVVSYSLSFLLGLHHLSVSIANCFSHPSKRGIVFSFSFLRWFEVQFFFESERECDRRFWGDNFVVEQKIEA